MAAASSLRRPAAPQRAAGFGLVSMRERATLVGGELEIDSTPGAGTSIFVRVPLPAAPAPGVVRSDARLVTSGSRLRARRCRRTARRTRIRVRAGLAPAA